MASIQNKKRDVCLPSKDLGPALASLKSMIEAAKLKAKGKKLAMWEFRSSPHEQFGRSLDDAFGAFLMWARVSDDDDDDAEWAVKGVINVSKAFRRLEAYAEWMEDTGTELTEPALVWDDDMAAVHRTWAMSTSVAQNGELVWWIDMGAIDKAAVKETPVLATFRYFAWYEHAIMYNANAKKRGVSFCESFGSNVGFWEAMTALPAKLSAKLNQLTLGTLPLHINYIMILDPPQWMATWRAIMGAIMGAEMMKYMVLLKKPDCWAEPAARWGAGCVPMGFAECGGTNTLDPVIANRKAASRPVQTNSPPMGLPDNPPMGLPVTEHGIAGGGFLQQVERIRSALGIDASLAAPAVLAQAATMMGVVPEGSLPQQVERLIALGL